jgi:hypothetical protein
VAVSQPAIARRSRGHVTPACAGRVFKARVAQGLPYRSHITLTDRADAAVRLAVAPDLVLRQLDPAPLAAEGDRITEQLRVL